MSASVSALERLKLYEDLGDALPYIDQLYADPSVDAQAKAMIADELRKSTKKPADYVAELARDATVHDFAQTQFFKDDLAAMVAGAPRPAPIDFAAQYAPLTPAESAAKLTSLAAVEAELARAQTALAMQQDRFENLQLAKRYGAAAWSQSLARTERVKTAYEAEAAQAAAGVAAVNRRRKQHQLHDVAPQLNVLAVEYAALVSQNHALAVETHALGQAVKRARTARDQQGAK